ncbi:MAG: hypothetical protein ACREDR_21070 [Blastocatellia bacterium]
MQDKYEAQESGPRVEPVAFPDVRSVYYHRDFDGVVSAAMVLSIADSQPELHPVDYHLRSGWPLARLTRPAAVADFLFHPDATVWVDHHADPFALPAWRDKADHNALYVWEVHSPSCPPLIARTFRFSRRLRRHFAPYIHWSSIIDSALYESAEQAADLNNPFLLISEILALPNTDPVANIIALEIAHRDVYGVLAHPTVGSLAHDVVQAQTLLRKELLSHVSYDGLVAFLDQSFVDSRFLRYYPYLIYPDAAYVVGIYRHHGAFTVSVGANPWKSQPYFNVGLLCRRHGGGGRKNVGGVPASTADQAKELAESITAELHGLAEGPIPVPSVSVAS